MQPPRRGPHPELLKAIVKRRRPLRLCRAELRRCYQKLRYAIGRWVVKSHNGSGPPRNLRLSTFRLPSWLLLFLLEVHGPGIGITDEIDTIAADHQAPDPAYAVDAVWFAMCRLPGTSPTEKRLP